MMVRRTLLISVLASILLLGISACVQAGTELSTATSISTSKETALPYPLATPYAQQPAAGICATFDGEVVTVTLNADIPDPRCAKVMPDQTLTVINNTVNPLSVSIGNFKTALLAGNSYSVDVPFGDYLAPGVHQLQVSPCCGVELWLEEK